MNASLDFRCSNSLLMVCAIHSTSFASTSRFSSSKAQPCVIGAAAGFDWFSFFRPAPSSMSSPKPFKQAKDFAVALVAHAVTALSKNILHSVAWPGNFRLSLYAEKNYHALLGRLARKFRGGTEYLFACAH